MRAPQPSDYHEYFETYIRKVPEGDIFDILKNGLERTLQLLADLPEGAGDRRYAPGKWSIKQVIGHLIDSERAFAYRAFSFARGEAGPLPGFEADIYAQQAKSDGRSIEDLARELEAVRRSSLELFRSFDEEMADRRGQAFGGFRFAARAFPWIIAGHEIHHRQLIEEKYLALSQG